MRACCAPAPAAVGVSRSRIRIPRRVVHEAVRCAAVWLAMLLRPERIRRPGCGGSRRRSGGSFRLAGASSDGGGAGAPRGLRTSLMGDVCACAES